MSEIISEGYDGTYKLVHKSTGIAVEANKSFDISHKAKYGWCVGAVAISGGCAPHKCSSEGKVWPVSGGEYYPSVFGLKWAKIEKDTAVKYPDIKVKLVGGDGNAFVILGTVKKAMRQARVPAEEIAQFDAEAKSGDYDHLLATCMDWVSVE